MRQQGTWGYLKHNITNRGWSAWVLSALLFAFYGVLYYTDLLTPIAKSMGLIHKWNLYGLIYTIAIVWGGIYVISKYRHNAYQIVRTSVVMFVQATLAFGVPYILELFNQPAVYLSYLWPLEIGILYPDNLSQFPVYFAIWAVVGSIVVAPVLGIFYGKRWYCSWVCGCGGLANTAGEPFRHLTPTTKKSWWFEKYAIHITLILALLSTGLVGASYLVGSEHQTLNWVAGEFRQHYKFLFVTVLSGIIGVALYPIGGTRIWCRNFCPMAAVLGIVQKPGRFQIRVKDNMCISCGLCSKYCEMGIDVRAYAQTNENFTRAACVGCGMCEEVCPRGVLHLENKSWDDGPGEVSLSDELIQSRG
jgi:polyferredoxin